MTQYSQTTTHIMHLYSNKSVQISVPKLKFQIALSRTFFSFVYIVSLSCLLVQMTFHTYISINKFISEYFHNNNYNHIDNFQVIFGSTVLLMLWLPIKVIRLVFPGFLPYRVVISRLDSFNFCFSFLKDYFLIKE